MSSFVSNVEILVSENRTDEALAIMLKKTDGNKYVRKSIVLLQSEFTNLKTRIIRGTISTGKSIRLHNRINESILDVLEFFNENGEIIKSSVRIKRSIKIIIKISLVFMVPGGLITFLDTGYYMHSPPHQILASKLMAIGILLFLISVILEIVYVVLYKFKLLRHVNI